MTGSHDVRGSIPLGSTNTTITWRTELTLTVLRRFGLHTRARPDTHITNTHLTHTHLY